MATAQPTIRIAQDEHADEVLSEDPFALLVGMLLDQQFPMEHAFRGPGQGARPVRHARPRARSPRPSPRPSPTCARRRRPSTATAARWPGAIQAARRRRARRVRRRRRDDLARGGRRRRPGRPAQGAARVRRPEGADLRGPARQAARGAPAGLAGGDRRLRRGRLLPLGGRRRRRRRRCRRCASSRRPPRRRPRPQRPDRYAGRTSGRGPAGGRCGGEPGSPGSRRRWCARRAAAVPADDPALARITWARGVENGREVWTCDTCSRRHLRSIEGKLDSSWW